MQIKDRLMIQSLFLILMLIFIFVGIAQGAQIFEYQANRKVKAVIGYKGLNRLQYGNRPITQVIGDDSQYSIIQDARGVNLFINPKVAIGEVIELALVDATGNVADMLLQVANVEGQLIIIQDKIDIQKKEYTADKLELKRIIRYMVRGKQDRYFTQHMKREIKLLEADGLKVMQDMSYRYGPYVGARLKVSNISRSIYKKSQEIELKDGLLHKLFNAEAIETRKECSKLKSGNSCRVWVAVKEVIND